MCIKKLKRNKSTGPDKIPNEAIIEADPNTRKIIRQSLNKMYEEEKIPKEWQHGEIIRIYKGKGEKGKCCNERGITLTSNLDKLFARLIDNRIKTKILVSEAQAGGQNVKPTADHLSIINNIINQNKRRRKPTYIAFLDVTKAYDKAWLNAILYTANKSGIKGKNWRMLKELNSNLTATIKTKHGNTRISQSTTV